MLPWLSFARQQINKQTNLHVFSVQWTASVNQLPGHILLIVMRCQMEGTGASLSLSVTSVRVNSIFMILRVKHHLLIGLGYFFPLTANPQACGCSTCNTGLTVTLKSPQSLTDPSGLGTGTTGVSHSLWSTLSITPICSSRSRSFSI